MDVLVALADDEVLQVLVVPGNVARIYARMARDLRDGTHTAPSFEDAVVGHRVIAAIERAAESGSRTVLAWGQEGPRLHRASLYSVHLMGDP